MNMNKALQNLYHAVSNETTTKVNISKLLVDIHYAITGKESANKNNWSKIINSMADNWPEGGGGSSDFSTAEVTIISNLDSFKMYEQCFACYEENELGEGSPTMLGTYIGIEPLSSVTLKVPLYKGCAYWMNPFQESGLGAVVTGDITNNSGNFIITGDGTITIS